MKKIPTLFERDWNSDKSRVINQVHAGCEWVVAGEGIATRKLDGTCCMIREGKLFKRREVAAGCPLPRFFEISDYDEQTSTRTGWLPCCTGPEDKWHMLAFSEQRNWPDGTYELIGPKVQGNPEGWVSHQLIAHGSIALAENTMPRTFDGLRNWFAGRDIEGIVFYHPDGRMAKIKLRDFGLKRVSQSAVFA